MRVRFVGELTPLGCELGEKSCLRTPYESNALRLFAVPTIVRFRRPTTNSSTLFHYSSSQHVVRQAPWKQGQEGCSVHRHGCRYVFFPSLFSLLANTSLALFVAFFVDSHANYIGASGTGRTTFVNTLCESEVLAHKVADNADTAHIEEGISIKPVNVGAFLNGSLAAETQCAACRTRRRRCPHRFDHR